jgi:hypothetical protein
MVEGAGRRYIIDAAKIAAKIIELLGEARASVAEKRRDSRAMTDHHGPDLSKSFGAQVRRQRVFSFCSFVPYFELTAPHRQKATIARGKRGAPRLALPLCDSVARDYG